MWNECNCAVVWTLFGTAFLWDWNENWPFLVLWTLVYELQLYFLYFYFRLKVIHVYLENNCFAILCWFLPYINMNQPQVYIYPLPFETPSHLPPHPTPLGWYRAPVWVSWAMQQIPIAYLFYIWQAKIFENSFTPN